MKISVAYIAKPRGLKGELAAVLYRPSSGSLKPGMRIALEKGDTRRDFEIEYIKPLRGRIGLKLREIDSAEQASAWIGAEILLERENLEPLENDEFYHFEIEGANVYDEDGTHIGTVKQLADAPGNDIMIVKSDDKEIMIPFIKAIVKTVDVENKRIVISPIEGLY